MSAHAAVGPRVTAQRNWEYRTSGPAQLRLTLRGKAVLATLAFACIAVLLLMGASAGVSTSYEAAETTTYTVTTGDSLWGVAKGVAQPGQDVRDIVLIIQKLNALDSADIFVGQQLLVPAVGS